MSDLTDETFENDTPADGDAVQRAFDDVGSNFPVGADLIKEVRMSQVVVDSTLPEEAFPASLFTTPNPNNDNPDFAQNLPALTALTDNAMYVQALGLSYRRKWVPTAYPDAGDKQDGGFMTPHLFNGIFCWTYCSGNQDKVYFVTTSGGAAGDQLKAEATFQLASGSEPAMAVSTAVGDVFVLCENGGSPKIDRINADGTVTDTWIDLTDTTGGLTAYTSIRKMVVNRWGTYLYIIGQVSGETAHLGLARIKISDASRDDIKIEGAKAGNYTTSTASADNGCVDIVCLEPDIDNPNDTYIAALMQHENAGTTDEPIIVILQGDSKDTDVDWTASPTVHTLQDPTTNGSASCDGRAMVGAGSNLFVLTDEATPAVRWACISYDPNASSGHVHKVLVGSDSAVTDDILVGSACYADTASARGVYAMLTTGNVIFWSLGASSLVEFSPAPGWSGTFIEKSSCCFNGRTLIVQGTKSAADGEATAGVYW